jgi:nucleoside-diphosphate-sugar epimerase
MVNSVETSVNVKDVCRANVIAATNEEYTQRYNAEVFNIGTGVNYSVNQVADMVSPTHNRINLPARDGEARITLCDWEKAQNWLGWSPQIQLSDWLSVDKAAV